MGAVTPRPAPPRPAPAPRPAPVGSLVMMWRRAQIAARARRWCLVSVESRPADCGGSAKLLHVSARRALAGRCFVPVRRGRRSDGLTSFCIIKPPQNDDFVRGGMRTARWILLRSFRIVPFHLLSLVSVT